MTTSTEPYDFTGKVVVITGGGAGFGEAFAKGFSARGASVSLLDLDLANAKRVADAVTADGGKALAIECDVANEDAVDAAIAQTIDTLGGVDVLFNNAGLHLSKYNRPFSEQSRAELRALLDVNVMGVINCTLACKDSMASRGGGSIINISSIAGYLNSSPYGVSKLAVRGLTTAFAQELSAEGIRVNAIAPGLIATPSAVADLPPEMFSNFANTFQQVKRRGEMDDIVNTGLFLASPASGFVTGETIKVSGGYPLNA